MAFQLNALDPSNSGSGGASLLGTYRTADAFADTLVSGYFDEGAANLRWTHALLVKANDRTGILLVSSDGAAVAVTEFGGGSEDPVSWDDIEDKPNTFPPNIGSGASDAMAGNTVIPPPLTPGSAVSDATDETDVVGQLNSLLASLRTAGLIEV